MSKETTLKRYLIPITLMLVAAALFTACSGGQSGPSAAPQDNDSPQASDYEGLIEALRAPGAKVEAAGEVSQPFFSVQGRALIIDGADVQIFEYADGAAADADSAQVAPDGDSVGTTMLSWIAPPHFFKTDRLIVLYIGEDANVLDALQEVLGPQFAGR